VGQEERVWIATPRQREFLLSEEDEVLYGGAVGGGKTQALLIKCAMRCMEVPGAHVLFLRRAYPDLEMSAIKSSHELFAGTGPKYDGGKYRWKFPHSNAPASVLQFGYLEKDNDVFRYYSAEFDLICFDELTQFCMTPEHEVLTESGWKPISEVRIGERVLSLTKEKNIVYGEVTATPAFPYKGKLISVRQRGICYDVTPNHRLVINKQNGDDWYFCEAKDLPRFAYHPRKGNWADGKETEWVTMPDVNGRGIGPNQNSATKINADDYLLLLGWYLSEGSAYLSAKSRGGTSPCVSIRQTKPNKELSQLMDRLPWRVKSDGDNGYKIYSRQLYEHFKPMGNTYSKRVPRFVMNLSKRQMKLFFDAFMAGNGYITPHGSIQIALANEGIVDDLQEISIKLGRVATKKYLRIRNKYDAWQLRVYTDNPERGSGCTEVRVKHRKEIDYEGMVHCLTVEPHHTFLVRYMGRLFWSGNSMYQFTFMLARCRTTKKGVKPLIRAATNPGGIGHAWVKSRFVDKCQGGKVYTDPDTRRTRRFIPAKLEDNPHIMENDPGYEQRLNDLPENVRKALREGSWEITSGLAFPEFSYDIHVCRTFQPDLWWKRWLANDPGYTDPFVWLSLAVGPDGKVYVYREITREPKEPRITYSDQARLVLDLSIAEDPDTGEKVPENYEFKVTGRDAFSRNPETGKCIVDYYNEGGLYGFLEPPRGQKTDRRFRKAVLHEYLKPYEDPQTGKMTARLQIMDCCEKLIETLPVLMEDEKDPERVALSGYNHWYDCVGYALIKWHSIISPLPQPEMGEIARIKEKLAKQNRRHRRRFW